MGTADLILALVQRSYTLPASINIPRIQLKL